MSEVFSTDDVQVDINTANDEAHSQRMADLVVRALLQETTGAVKEIWTNDHEDDRARPPAHDQRSQEMKTLALEEARLWEELDPAGRARLQRDAHKLHVYCGQPPPVALARASRRRGAPTVNVARLKMMQCETCFGRAPNHGHW